MNKHTPGPWHLTTDALEPHRTWWIGKGDRLFEIGKVSGPIGKPAEIKANAALIAKAPDLLAALKATLPIMEDRLDSLRRFAIKDTLAQPGIQRMVKEIEQALDQARTLIAELEERDESG